MAKKLNLFSAHVTQVKSQGASQALLYGTGLTAEDLDKPQVGIASVWYEGNTCNMHLLDLAARVKQGVEAAGLVGLRFNTVGVSDGLSMGTSGMSFSLQSRDLIADSIETVMEAQWYDANISLPGCDKNMPGCVMAMGRFNRPSLMVYGGTIRPGQWEGGSLDIVSAFESYGELLAGRISEEERQTILRNACPGAGACGGMYTANIMASAIEALGMSLPYSASAPATSPEKVQECADAGAAMRRLLEEDIKPRDIMTRAAFENASATGERTSTLRGGSNIVYRLARVVTGDHVAPARHRQVDRRQSVVDVLHVRVELVTQPVVDRQIATRAPVVLRVEVQPGGARVLVTTPDARPRRGRETQQVVGQRVAAPLSGVGKSPARGVGVHRTELQVEQVAAELEAVVAPGD